MPRQLRTIKNRKRGAIRPTQAPIIFFDCGTTVTAVLSVQQKVEKQGFIENIDGEQCDIESVDIEK